MTDSASSSTTNSTAKSAAHGARDDRGGDVQLVVPIFNEGENVRLLYRALLDAGVAFDSLKFVYDLDDDTGLPFIEEISHDDHRVMAEKNEFGRGVVRALRWGFSHAKPGPLLVVMADGSDELSLISRMVEMWRAGATVVVASRYMPGGSQQGGPVVKRTLSRWAGKSLALCGFPTSDPTNNFKLYDGDWLRRQEIESVGGFEVALELCYKAFRDGQTICQLPTHWRDRTAGESRFRLFAWLGNYLHWYLRALPLAMWRRLERLAGRTATSTSPE